MPLINHDPNSRCHFVVRDRPLGMRYATGSDCDAVTAVLQASKSFQREFGALPPSQNIYMEVFGMADGDGFLAYLYERVR